MKRGDTTFIFRYVLNKLVGFNYNDNVTSKEYLYQRNIQGDIIGIYDDEGNQVGEYAYDGYGNQVIVKDEGGIASLNPFRYRGYYFDEETGFYYLNARYYDPETGRFISPDTLSILDETKGQINGLNLYMYCADNPIMNVDPSGQSWKSFWKSVRQWFENNWQWIVGAAIILTCAILTVVTAGGFAAAGGAILSVFTSTMAVNATAAAFAGALVGSILLAGAGTVIGGLISISNGGRFLDGAKWVFFGGAVLGAIIGGAWGYFHYALQAAGKMGVKVDINSLLNNPNDEFVTIGPKNGKISEYIRSISDTGQYGQIFVHKVSNGVFQIANGHHRVAALRLLGHKFINVFLVP